MGTPVKEQDEGWLMLPMTFCGQNRGTFTKFYEKCCKITNMILAFLFGMIFF